MAYLTFFLALVFLIFPTSHSLPFIFFHGLEDECTSNTTIKAVEMLKKASGVEGQCLEINNNRSDDTRVALKTQIHIACEKVKDLGYLKEGFNIFAVSQGTLIARGVIEFCDGAPPVRNYISLAGPQAGVGGVSEYVCEQIKQSLNITWISCSFLIPLFEFSVYMDPMQDIFTIATYYKLPNRIPDYLAKSKFLPELNNERPYARNSTYRERFISLDNLVLLMNENDMVLMPKETAWFGYYKDGSYDTIKAEETQLYKEDWIGLRNLTEAGKVKRFKVKGGHAVLSEADAIAYVVPYLKNKETSNLKNLSKKSLWNGY